MLAPCKKQRYLGRREREKYLGRREKGVKKFREKGDRNLGDIGPRSGVAETQHSALYIINEHKLGTV